MPVKGYGPESLRTRFENIRARVNSAAIKANRSPDEIRIIAISKTHPASVVRHALEAGVTDLGENRVQEAEVKIEQLGHDSARWHLVGHLQPNKARKAVRLFDTLHSLDSVPLAQRLERICIDEDRNELSVLIQVALANEQTKSGIKEDRLSALVETVSGCPHLRLVGLMTLPPFFDDAERTRPYFRRLRELRDKLKNEGKFGNGLGELSMGMTNDFEVAIEEGASMLRIGTAIFGERMIIQSEE
jgi:pyridoxal phosphate enzyme (YggS family)